MPALAGKFSAPVAFAVVPRPRLFEQLSSTPPGTLLLLSASAGWGKTLLLVSWLEALPTKAVAWLSLDAADNDVPTFWRDVVAALALAVGGAEPTATRLRALAGDASNDPHRVVDRLAEALVGLPAPVVLVLDDLHTVSSIATHNAVLRLAAHAGPHLRIAASTRHDPPWPMQRLRVQGQLMELRSDDLAFDASEAGALLAAAGLALRETELTALVDRTEGWPVGLRLAALHLAHTADPAGFLAEFSGDEHSVSDYVLSEMLEPAGHLRDFLVPVSIVDPVSGDLADALTGRHDGAQRLAELAAANVFMHALDRPGQWYRLHGLVADVLRGQLANQATRRHLHRRASTWYRTQDQPWPALEHAVQAAWWPVACELAGVHVAEFVLHGDARRLDMLLSAIPHDVLLSRPELGAALAGARLIQSRFDEVHELTEAAQEGVGRLPPPRRKRTRAFLAVVEMGLHRLAGDPSAMLAASRQLPEDLEGWATLGLAGWDALSVTALSNRGTAELWLGDEAAASHLQAAAQMGRWAQTALPRLNCENYLSLLAYQRGDLTSAAERAGHALAELADLGYATGAQAAAGYLALAGVGVDRDELEDADRSLDAAAKVVAAVPEPPVALTLATLAARRRAAGGDAAGALADLRATLDQLSGWTPPPALADRLSLTEADLSGRDGNVPEALSRLDRLDRTGSGEVVAARARLLLLQAQVHSVETIAATIEALQAESDPDLQTLRQRVDSTLLIGLLAAQLGQPDMALQSLEAALNWAAPELLRRPFLDHAELLVPLLSQRLEHGTDAPRFTADLLHRCTERSHPQSRSPLPAPLTARETVVLEYMVTTLSNAEIAAALFVSVNTVKSHQASIFRKLGVSARRDAVNRARDLGLLSH